MERSDKGVLTFYKQPGTCARLSLGQVPQGTGPPGSLGLHSRVPWAIAAMFLTRESKIPTNVLVLLVVNLFWIVVVKQSKETTKQIKVKKAKKVKQRK